jgi:SAM-dependent methyltransferase/chorismate mutase
MESDPNTAKNRRVNRFNLGELSQQLARVDRHLVDVLARRSFLARQVEEWKSLEESDPSKQIIIRPAIETKRLNEFAQLAESKGLSSDFARVILWANIAESCRVQIDQKQTRNLEEEKLFESDKLGWYKLLKANLLKLTGLVAPSLYDTEMYGDKASFAMKIYMAYEDAILQREIDTLRATGQLAAAVDMGCATGRWSLRLAQHFARVTGYDISPEMIKQATAKAEAGQVKNVTFTEADIEGPLNIPKDSVSLVVMNLGTASDIPNLRGILAKINGALCKNGRFILSFYNSRALFYRWFIPWPVSLIAEVSQTKHCLDVRSGKDIFQIYARPYTIREVTNCVKSSGLVVSDTVTFPAMASILPDAFFDDENARKAIEEIDRKLANSDQGAYIIVTGRKS